MTSRDFVNSLGYGPTLRAGLLNVRNGMTSRLSGYGDVTPLSPVAQIWSALEATLGVFYLGILVARLVSIYRT